MLTLKMDNQVVKMPGDLRVEVDFGVGDGYSLIVILTHEGIITDLIKNGEVVQTQSEMYQEIAERMMDNDRNVFPISPDFAKKLVDGGYNKEGFSKYTFDFMLSDHEVTITRAFSEEGESILSLFGEELKKLGEEFLPEEAHIGEMTIDVETGKVYFDIHFWLGS